MTVKDAVIERTQNGIAQLFRFARAVPEDKLTWRPSETNRTVLDIVQECTQSPAWATGLITDRKLPDFSPEAWEAMLQERSGWSTLDQCEAECNRRAEAFYEAVRSFPEEELQSTMFLPFGNKDYSFTQIMDFPAWNMNYHVGQIAYVQMMYGDKEMY